jgi:peptidoglycan/LPS O-acetylase OafA/YrhL
MRCVTAARVPYSQLTHHFPTHLRVDGLMFGVLLSYVNATHTEALRALVRAHRTKLVVLAATLLAPIVALPTYHSLMHTIGFTAVYLGCGALVLVAVHADEVEHGPVHRCLAFVGFHSYSIYLWHLFAHGKASRLVGDTETVVGYVAFLVVYVFVAVIIGVVAARIIEVPTLKLRDRLLPSRANGPVADGPSSG